MILPQGQNEDSDPSDGPEVRKEKLAWLAPEAEQTQAQEDQGDRAPAFDRTHEEDQADRQQRQPLIRPDLVGDQRSEGEAERHAVSRVPIAAPRRPRRTCREEHRAQVREH